ncbi:glycosyltransferase family 2 protein [Paenibacillus chartarius]|uniref:Glycosyltransferase family 2 protein n=1 Tax=Paenibacillus chartarius TaxID=747481 RepID=A0ABV6DRK4_9BACL
MVDVLLIGSGRSWELELTASSVRAALPQAQLHIIDEAFERCPADRINGLMHSLNVPYWLTVQAGTTLTGVIQDELERAIRTLERGERTGWIMLGDGQEAIVWKRECVRSGLTNGFAGRPFLPFPRWMLHDKQLQCARLGWHGLTLSGDGVRQGSKRERRDGTAEERELIAPILERAPTLWGGEQPDISVVLCTHNEADYIPWAIRSVMAQTCPAWELIIVDDGSTDGTRERIDALLADSRVFYVRMNANQGKSSCLNRALQDARGRWLLELDADDWLAPGCLEALRTAAASGRDDIAMWYGDCHEWAELSGLALRYKGVRRAPAAWDRRHFLEKAVPIAPRLYDTEAIRRLGGWTVEDPSNGRLYEDFWMIAKLADRFRLAYVDLPLYHRRLRSSSITQRHREAYPAWKQWLEEKSGRKRSE